MWDHEENWKPQPEILFPEKKIVSSALVGSLDFWKLLFEKYSTWTKLVRIVARVIQAVKKWKEFRRLDNRANSYAFDPLSVKNLEISEGEIVRIAQSEIHNRVKRDLQQLRCEFIDGFLCVGGRLRNADIAESAKHPKILPSDHRVTALIISDCHERSGHLGVNYTLSKLRERYWILRGVSTVKRILNKCHTCRRYHRKVGEQLTANLPKARVNISDKCDKFPFASVGLDIFGPFYVQLGPNVRGRRGPASMYKRYGCIFTCLRMRAVHIESVRDLSSDSFIQAVMRFVARRGAPIEIYSDNGSNFKGASCEVIDALKKWNHADVQNRLADARIQWHFNPPASSHQGGAWERMIRTIRQILSSLIEKNVMNDETLNTVFCEVEKILNDRPITRVPSESGDLRALTPNDLLLLKKNPCTSLVDTTEKSNARIRWKYAQSLANQFWSRWIREYLPTLQSRQKWLRKMRNLKVGDLVLVVDFNLPRGSWKKGLVTEVFEDNLGCVRRVMLKLENGVIMRDVRKLCLLDEELLAAS